MDTEKLNFTRRKIIEGSFADAANNHGFKRSRFRGIEKARIQNLMIANTTFHIKLRPQKQFEQHAPGLGVD